MNPSPRRRETPLLRRAARAVALAGLALAVVAKAAPEDEPVPAAPDAVAPAAPESVAPATATPEDVAPPSEAVNVPPPGPALRAGVEAMKQGDDARALALLEAVAVQHPLVADYADLFRVEILSRGDDPAAAAAAAREAVARHPKSPLAARLEVALGDALAAVGDEAGARAAWEIALEQTDRRAVRTQIYASLAESYERDGQAAAAAEAWLQVWRRDPLSPQDDLAEARLRAFEAALPKPLRTGLDHRARGDALRALGHNERAIVAYDAALAIGDLQPRNRRATMRSRAQSLFDIRRYGEAIDAFAALAPDPDSQVSRARSIARAGDVPAAIAELESIGGGGWGRTSVYARFLAALLLEDEDDLPRARRHFEAIARNADYPRYANPSRWYLGWTAWRQGDTAEAREHFRLLEARLDDDPIEQLRARYWRIRASEKLGDADAAKAYANLAGEYPITYYGWRAGTHVEAPTATTPEPIEPGRERLAPLDLARGQILLEAGLPEEASQELTRVAARAGGVRDRVAVGRLLADAGEYHQAQTLIVRHYHEDLARGVVPGQEDLWWLAWPEAYGALVRELSPKGAALEPAIVSAVMREESGYRPGVTSPAGARGLLQIMPETGERLAAQLGFPAFTPDDLYRPRVNIQLGAFYLQQLASEFGGRMEAAIASYNAGPSAAARWTREQPGLEDDEWVEAVPYSQTQAYVKRVLRSVHAYRRLY